MISKIAMLNTSRSGPGQSLTLVGYSSVLPKNHWNQTILIRVTIFLTTIGRTLIEPRLLCVGETKGVLSNVSVDRLCVFMQVKLIYTFKMYILQILHQNRAQNIIQCHDNNIWKQMCIKKLSYSTETYLWYNVQGGERSKNTCELYIPNFSYSYKVGIVFAMYQNMRLMGESLSGTRHKLFSVILHIPRLQFLHLVPYLFSTPSSLSPHPSASAAAIYIAPARSSPSWYHHILATHAPDLCTVSLQRLIFVYI